MSEIEEAAIACSRYMQDSIRYCEDNELSLNSLNEFVGSNPFEVRIKAALGKPAEWTKEPPTEPGWYWYWRKEMGSEVNSIYLTELKLLVVNQQQFYWMKMAVPQPPKE